MCDILRTPQSLSMGGAEKEAGKLDLKFLGGGRACSFREERVLFVTGTELSSGWASGAVVDA